MLFRHASAYFLARGVPAALSFLSVALYTRMLAPTEYGKYALALAAAMMGNAVLFWWLRSGMLRFFASEHKSKILNTALFVYFVLIFLLTILALLFHILWPQPTGDVAALTALLTATLGLYEMTLELARAQLNPAWYGVLSLLRSTSMPVLGVALIYMGLGALGLLLAAILSTLLPSFLGALRLWKGLRPWPSQMGFAQLTSYGLPLGLTYLFSYAIGYADRFMLALFLGPAATGIYAAAYDLAFNGINTLGWAIGLATAPIVVAKYEAQEKDNAREQLIFSSRLLSFTLIPATSALAFFSKEIVATILGEEFRQGAAIVLAIVGVAAMLHSIRNMHFDLIHQLLQRTKLLAFNMGSVAAVNIAGNALIIPKHGITGAALVTAISYFLALVLSWYQGVKLWQVPFDIKTSILYFSLALISFALAKCLLTTLLRAQGVWPIELGLGMVFYILLATVQARGKLISYLAGRRT